MEPIAVVINKKTGNIVDKFYEGDSYVKKKNTDKKPRVLDCVFVSTGEITDSFFVGGYYHYTKEDNMERARYANYMKKHWLDNLVIK